MLRTFQRYGLVLSVMLLAISARAFSLWGPVGNGGDSYQDEAKTYGNYIAASCPGAPGGFVGAPKNLGEEYRRNYTVVYYGFEQTFLNYFGATGASAVDLAFTICSNYYSVPQTAPLSAYPLDAIRVNPTAQALRIYDLKSETMGIIHEAIGLAQPDLWVWTLRDRVALPGGCPAYRYTVIQRNFDPATWLPSRYINGTLYTYVIDERCASCDQAEALKRRVDPAQPAPTAVSSSFFLARGHYYTGISRDDVGGFRYLYRTNNYNVEGIPLGGDIITGGSTNLNLTVPLSTVDLYLFAQQTRTNNGAGLLALYPNLQISSTSNYLVQITTTNIVGVFTNYPNSQLTITNTGAPQYLFATNDLALLAEQSLTNTASVLSNLYPGIIVSSETLIFTNVTTTNITVGGYTNYPYAPPGTLLPYYVTNYSYNFTTYYKHTFANVVTNKVYYTNTITTYTTNLINQQPYSVPGTFSSSVNVSTSISTNGIGGTFYILPTNVCAYSIISTQAPSPFVTTTTNLTINSSLFDGTTISRGVVRYVTNYVYVAYPVSCFANTVTLSNSIGTNFFHTFDNVITNISATTSRVTILTTNITPCGGGYCTNIVNTDVLTNQISGSVFILPTNQCGLSIVNTQFVNVVASTNFLASGTNSSGTITNQAVVAYYTNYTVLINPVQCTTSGGTNAAASRQGVGTLQFVRRDYDSLLGRLFTPVTNVFTSYALVNNQLVPQVIRRIASAPDMVFRAEDLNLVVYTRTTGNFVTNNIVGNLAGPGNIDGGVDVTFNKTGPSLQNVSPSFVDQASATTNAVWGYFDGTTNAPIVFPDSASITNLENQLIIQVTTPSLPDGTNTVAYTATQLAGSGGLKPYTWTISPNSASGLPNGMNLSAGGLINGTPAAGSAGIYDITVRLTDFAGRAVVREYVITIY